MPINHRQTGTKLIATTLGYQTAKTIGILRRVLTKAHNVKMKSQNPVPKASQGHLSRNDCHPVGELAAVGGQYALAMKTVMKTLRLKTAVLETAAR